jgi:hypothetical protein
MVTVTYWTGGESASTSNSSFELVISAFPTFTH